MNKTSVLPLLIFALVVSGCTSTPKKKKSTLDTSSIQTSINPGTSSVEASSQVASTSISPSSSSSITPHPEPGTEVTRLMETSLDSFETGTGFTAGGRQIDNHDDSQPNDRKKNAELLTNYFSTICDIEGMIGSITYTALNTNVDRNNGTDIYLTIGTSDAGKIVWQSVVPMKKVVLKVNNYHKWYRDYSKETEEQWHTDSAKLIVNGSETSMAVTETNVEPESRIVTYEPSETFTTLTIENELIGGTDHNRIFLESIQITWIY
ncbi:MAG: hypothetical protein IJQ40_02410 [Bacilli bacterium]|nr:hypothetical protein [Bacilli bacterium]